MAKTTTQKNGVSKPIAVVVGGGNFLGQSLCDTLITQNLEVFWISPSFKRFPKETYSSAKLENLHLVEADITKLRLDPLMSPQYIFQLAGYEACLKGEEPQLQALLINSQGTANLLEVAKSSQAKFLLLSRLDPYSGDLSEWDLENLFGKGRKDLSRLSHHETSRFAEALTLEYIHQFNIDARIVRVTEVYGPGMTLNASSYFYRLLYQVANSEFLTVEGDGLTPVHPTYVSDIIYGVIKAVVSPETRGKIFNLIDPQEVTVLSLAYMIRNALGGRLPVVFVKGEQRLAYYPFDKQALIKTQKELGWRSKVSLEQGITKTVEWIIKGQKSVSVVTQAVEEMLPETLPTAIPEPETAQPSKPPQEEEFRRKELPPQKESEPALKRERDQRVVEEKKVPTTLKIKSSIPIGVRRAKPKVSREFKLPSFKLGLFRLPKLTKPKIRIPRPRLKLKTRRFFVFISSLSIIVVIGLGPPAVFASSSLLGTYRLRKSLQAVKEQKIEVVSKETNLARQDFARADLWLERSRWLAGILGQREQLERWRALNSSLQETVVALNHLMEAAPSALKTTRSILGQDQGEVSEHLRLAQVELELADTHLALAEAQLKRVSPSDYPFLIRKGIEELTTKVPKARTELAGVRDLLQVLPSIIGTASQRSYLLLLQNNMELRPGGGFIGSFGLIKFINGRMVDLTIDDVYNADGQLKIPVTPPKPIKDYLKQANWYLRDSNWSPHFPTNAAQAQWFIKNELGEVVDGVVAFDLSFVQGLLSVLGSVELPDYQETITNDNLFEKAERQVEVDFFPGSSQKRDFLGALARTTIQKLVAAQEGSWPALMTVASKAAREKHLSISLTDAKINQILEDRGLVSSVPLYREVVSGNHLQDFLMVVDANLGTNKANYFVKRSVFHQVVVDKDGNLAERVTIEYDNQSPAETWPGGTYVNYLRVYVTSGAVLQDVRIDNRTVPGDVERGRELGKTVWALPVQVPIKSKVTVSFDYHLSDPLAFEGGLAVYELQILKQIGTIDDHYRLTFNTPAFYEILKTEPRGKAQDQAVVFSTTLEEDRIFRLEVIK